MAPQERETSESLAHKIELEIASFASRTFVRSTQSVLDPYMVWARNIGIPVTDSYEIEKRVITVKHKMGTNISLFFSNSLKRCVENTYKTRVENRNYSVILTVER